ncbi:GNAT family N-acetyltransferase [Streptomyces tsukubensis]|uniref:GNAT family N-acetyltransferase n=1 Tax=Streptomyces tsukubensis TaxID=83656 RepID=A0A1V4A8H0_9ACTN|nr:GNAT family N-acetyltransferase [Streptomyces tsukubensis]OON79239.1 GNAT family N-acetyltransferase [Streptomyces tsukubensis]QFR94642.1 GNAT family N-acetyltransferase [Streptomyces tsukubensis]
MSTPSSLSSSPVRRLTLRDLRACTTLAEGRGWPAGAPAWRLLLTAGTAYGVDDPDGGLAASCVLTSYGPADHPHLGAVGMLLVARHRERQGMGRRMMRHVMEKAGPTPLALYATPSGKPLYEELGFKAIGVAERLQGRLTAPVPPLSTAVRPATAADLRAVIQLDTEVMGYDRTHIVTRLPAFADRFLVVEEAGGISGYAASWDSDGTHIVGPVIASDTATATSLLAALAAGTELELRTDIDDRHTELRQWLSSHGLRTVLESALMCRGIADLPGDWTRRFAPLTTAAT